MGGKDDESNLIKLPRWAHAEVHKRLYEVYGKIEDLKAANMLGAKLSPEQYDVIINNLRNQLIERNKKGHSEETKNKIKNAQLESWKVNYENRVEGIRQRQLGKPAWNSGTSKQKNKGKCECGKIITYSHYRKYHRKNYGCKFWNDLEEEVMQLIDEAAKVEFLYGYCDEAEEIENDELE